MNYICRVLDYMAWFWFMEWLILVYIINRIIHGRLEIWNLSSRVHIRYLTHSLRSLVRYRCEHSKINSISPRDHVLFSIYYYYYYNHNYNKIVKSDWLSTALISALIGQYASCLSNWTVRAIKRALKWLFFHC